MIYIFDSSSFIVLSHYFPQRFPTFWEKFNNCVSENRVLSVREVYNELNRSVTKPHLLDWIERNKSIFTLPYPDETEFVREIFIYPSFQLLVKQRQILKGGPAADPFLIAAAKIKNACVVTEENKRDDAIRIPNVCEHFNVAWTSLEGLMEQECWTF